MKVDAPCPECDASPVDVLRMVDGDIWICPDCGHHEVAPGVDIESQLDTLKTLDPDLAAAWRETLGL